MHSTTRVEVKENIYLLVLVYNCPVTQTAQRREGWSLNFSLTLYMKALGLPEAWDTPGPDLLGILTLLSKLNSHNPLISTIYLPILIFFSCSSWFKVSSPEFTIYLNFSESLCFSTFQDLHLYNV